MEDFYSLYRFVATKSAVWLGLAAALFYSSWPLGLILNPAVGRHELASQLQASNQPYSWLFILLDVLTGVALVAAGYMQIHRPHSQLIRLCIASYMIFGVMVAAAALTPLNCDPTLSQCGPLIHQPLILLHGFFSIGSVTFLLISALIASATALDKKLGPTHFAIAALLICWLIFGLGGTMSMLHHDHSNILQDYFISVCSFSIILAVTTLEQSLAGQPIQSNLFIR